MNPVKFAWSNRNQLEDGLWGVFYYSPGNGMATGEKVYYGRNVWSDEATAIQSQEDWEPRMAGLAGRTVNSQ